MTKFSNSFVHNLIETLVKSPIPSNIKNEKALERAIYRMVRNYAKKALGVGDGKIDEILFTHGVTKEEKKRWTQSKEHQNVIVHGFSNTGDIFIKEERLGTIYIELKFVSKRSDKGENKLSDSLQKAIGQSIIASLVHPHVICLIVCETKIRKHEEDHSLGLREKLREQNIELILRSISG